MYVRYTKNLKNSNYKKPTGGSITDNLQNTKSMKEKLKNYVRVENIDDVPLNTHVRYITWKDGVQKFRLGGLLKKMLKRILMFVYQVVIIIGLFKKIISIKKVVLFLKLFFLRKFLRI